MAAFLSKYGVARHIYIPIIKRAVVDFAVGADWSPAAGDVKISKDGGAAANVTNLPSAITMGNTAMWDFSLTATEIQAAQVVVTVADSATKAVEDTMFIIETHGNASAQFQVDLADGVRAGLTALPNAAAEAAGGLYTRGSGAGQINQPANGSVDTNSKTWNGLTTVALPLVPATAGRTLVVDAAGLADANVVKLGPTGAGTAQTARDVGASVIAASVTAGVTVTTNNDKTGYALSAAAVQAIWDALTSALTTVGSVGKRIADFLTGDAFVRIGAAGAGLTALGDTRIANLDATISSRTKPADTQAAVTNLTNAPTAGDFTATMKASIGTAVAASAVASVTGNVGGNLLGTLSTAERAAVADALLDRDMSAGVDSGSTTVRTMRQALRFLRNKWTIAAGTLTVKKEDDTATSWTGTVTTTAGDPASQIDPAG